MASTIGHELARDLPHCNIRVDQGRKPTTSKKPWTNKYNHLPLVNQPSARASVDATLGTVEISDVTDTQRLTTPVNPIQPFDTDVFVEGDVIREFHHHLGPLSILPWLNTVQIDETSLRPPPQGSNVDNCFIDHLITIGTGTSKFHVAVGDFKRPGIINADQWTGNVPIDEHTLRLGRELRGYAHQYRTPHIFCYDALHLLLVRFRAQSREDIRHCHADVFLIPRDSQIGDVTMNQGLYYLIREGWQRCIGERSSGINITTSANPQLTRRFEYWSGQPQWFHQDGQLEANGASGWRRQFDATAMRWSWVHNVVQWDTVNVYNL